MDLLRAESSSGLDMSTDGQAYWPKISCVCVNGSRKAGGGRTGQQQQSGRTW